MHLIILGTCLTMAYAMPSYIAVPADQIAFVDLTALRSSSRSRIRVPRQTLTPPPQLPEAIYEENYQPIPIHNYHQGTVALAPPPPPETGRILNQPEEDETPSSSNIGAVSHFADRPPDFGEYVDFGAHTGDNGAFGWYADYPVNNQDSHGYRK